MAHIMDLPFEMLNTIITMVAMSSDGAKDLARASATSCEDIAGMSFPLFAYITDLVGSDMACASGIFCAIAKLCIIERSISRRFQSLPRVYPFLKRATPAQLSQPPRERVLELFDMLFPPSPL